MSKTLSVFNQHDYDQSSSLPLNYDCLWKIFTYCDIKTLCTLANVCKEFRTEAENVFRHKYTKIETSGYDRSVFRRLLCKFGYLIISLDMSPVDSDFYEIDAGKLEEYCPNLKYLRLQEKRISCNTSKRLFTRLKSLVIECCDLIGEAKHLFENCSVLEDLHVTDETINDILHTFPKLKRFKFDPKNNHKTCNAFCKFLELNPNLKYLYGEIRPNDKCISAILKHTPNLEVLELKGDIMDFPHSSEKCLLNVINLKKLRELALTGSYNSCSAVTLMEALSNANIRLETLSLDVFKIGTVKNISNLKTIHTLRLTDFTCHHENDLISLLIQLPLLNKLEISLLIGTALTSAVIDAIRDFNTSIKELAISGFKIDSTTIQSILNLKSLNVFRLLNIKQDARMSQNDLILLVTELPLLTEIEFKCINKGIMPMTVDGLKNVVQCGKRLTNIKLRGVKNLHINKRAIETIIDAVQINERLSIYFEGCRHETSFDVFDDKSSDNRLEICYKERIICTDCRYCIDTCRNI